MRWLRDTAAGKYGNPRAGAYKEVGRVTWTGDGRAGIIRPGEFEDFGLSVGVPDKPGAALTFKAVQTYANGELVRWIGAPDSEEPAPRVELTADDSESAPRRASAPAAESDDGAPVWLAVAGLVLGGGGLLTGGAALAVARRR